MSTLPTLDAPALLYASQPLPGAITLLRSADTTEFLLRPMPRTLLALFIPPLIAIILAAALIAWPALAGIPHSRFSSIDLLLPASLGVISLLVTALQLFPSFFPITLNISAKTLELRWRTLTRIHSLHWDRTAILGFRIQRASARHNILRPHVLVLIHRDFGDVIFLARPHAQLEALLPPLHSALALDSTLPAFMNILPPTGCHWRRRIDGGSLFIDIPPRHQLLAQSLMILPSLAAAFIAFHELARLNGNEETPFQTVIRTVVSLIIALGAYAIVRACINPFRRATHIRANPAALRIVETGLSPLNAQWPNADITAIAPLPNPRKPARAALRITFTHAPELLLLHNTPLPHVQWLTTLLIAARTPLAANDSPSPTPGSAS